MPAGRYGRAAKARSSPFIGLFRSSAVSTTVSIERKTCHLPRPRLYSDACGCKSCYAGHQIMPRRREVRRGRRPPESVAQILHRSGPKGLFHCTDLAQILAVFAQKRAPGSALLVQIPYRVSSLDQPSLASSALAWRARYSSIALSTASSSAQPAWQIRASFSRFPSAFEARLRLR